MHGTIIQIENEPVSKDNYITSSDICTEHMNEFRIDYVGDDRWDSRPGIVEQSLPSEMFDVNGREIKVNVAGIHKVLDKMVDEIKRHANSLTPCTIVKWEYLYRLRNAIKCYDNGKSDTLFWYQEELIALNDFILSVEGVGQKSLYVGAVLDYHF